MIGSNLIGLDISDQHRISSYKINQCQLGRWWEYRESSTRLEYFVTWGNEAKQINRTRNQYHISETFRFTHTTIIWRPFWFASMTIYCFFCWLSEGLTCFQFTNHKRMVFVIISISKQFIAFVSSILASEVEFVTWDLL